MKLYFTLIAICATVIAQATIKTDCSKIILQSGRVIEAEIVDMNEYEVYYRRCGQKTNVNYSILTELVLVVKNSQNEVIFFPKKEIEADFLTESQKMYEINALFGLIFSIGFPLIAFYFMYRSEQILQEYPNRYKKVNRIFLRWAKWIAIAFCVILLLVGLALGNVIFG